MEREERKILSITTFSENNRTKVIGHSMYRICNKDTMNGKGKWYIHETFNDGETWSQGNAYFRESLEEVIDMFNMLSKECTITQNCRIIPAPMSEYDAYDYYMYAYNEGIFSLKKLQEKHRDSERSKEAWEKRRLEGLCGARDYETHINMQRALKNFIRDILYDKLDSSLKPVPDSIEELNLDMEEKKITISHRLLLSALKKHMGLGDSGYHNIRAFLINRVEQASGNKLKVDLDGMDPMSVAKIRNRE